MNLPLILYQSGDIIVGSVTESSVMLCLLLGIETMKFMLHVFLEQFLGLILWNFI